MNMDLIETTVNSSSTKKLFRSISVNLKATTKPVASSSSQSNKLGDWNLSGQNSFTCTSDVSDPSAHLLMVTSSLIGCFSST